MRITANEFISNAKKYLGWAYVYGAKGKPLSETEILKLAKQYPSVFTKNYLARTLKNANKDATDCSGLIYLATNKEILLGSSQLLERAKTKGKITTVKDAPIGSVLYKQGHVGIKISDSQHIESRGVDYGVVIKDISSQKWTHGLVMDFVDCSMPVPKKAITNKSSKDDIKWLQSRLNVHIEAKHLGGITKELDVDGIWGVKTKDALLSYYKYKKWSNADTSGYYVGTGTITSLTK